MNETAGILIRIASQADTAGIDKAKESLGELEQESKSAFENQGGLNVEGLQSKLTSLLPVIGALAGAWASAQKALQEYAEAERESAQLDTALANAGQLTDEYREKLQSLAGQLQSTTAIADDKWIATLTTLTKFGADSSNIDKYAEAVKNLAGFIGGNIEEAAFIFGKAMQGSTEMLGRYGIEVDKSKSQTEQLDSIMAQVAQRGGGQLEAMAGTLSGRWQTLNLATSDVMESFGRMVAQTGFLQEGMGILSSMLQVTNDVMGGTIPTAEGLANKIILQGQSAEDAAVSLKDYQESLGSVKGASDDVSESLASQTKFIDDQAKQLREVTRAEKDLALAKIEADSSLSKEDKTKARAVVEKNFSESELNASIAAASDKITAREAAIKTLEEQASANRLNLAEQRARAEAAKIAETEAQAQADGLNSIAAEKEKLQREYASRNKAQAKQAGMMVMDPTAEADKKAILEQIAALDEKAAAIGKPDEEAKKAAQIEAANLRAAEQANAEENKRNEAIQTRLRAENAAESQQAEARKKVAGIEAKTADVRTSAVVATIKAEADATSKILAAKKEQLALETLINEAKVEGNKSELERLEWIKRQMEAKAKGLSDDEATRFANAASGSSGSDAKFSSPKDAVSGLVGGSNIEGKRKRGPVTSDAFGEDVPIGQSLLDHYKATQDRPVGSVNGRSILPADPTSSANPTSSAGDSQSSGGLTQVADKLKGGLDKSSGDIERAAKTIDGAASGFQDAAGKLAGSLGGLARRVQSCESQINALSAKV